VGFFAEGLRRGAQLILGGNAEVLGVALLSLRVALVATVAACAIGIPLGFAVGTTRFWGKRAALTALNTMLAFPTVVIGLLAWGLLARGGPLGGLGLLYTWVAIVLAEVVLAVPIAAALTAAAVQAVDPRVRRTALTLGAGPWRAYWAVAREARFALLSAVVVAFGRVLAEVGAAMIVGGNIRFQTRTLTTAVALATSQGDFGLAMALGMVLFALAITVNVLLQLLQGRADARGA
jgi:tungstate transport system permease protein